jgi:hypothetical protein
MNMSPLLQACIRLHVKYLLYVEFELPFFIKPITNGTENPEGSLLGDSR